MDDDFYKTPLPDRMISDMCDVDDPKCNNCGTTRWEYCVLGDHNKIKSCSECAPSPTSSNFHKFGYLQ